MHIAVMFTTQSNDIINICCTTKLMINNMMTLYMIFRSTHLTSIIITFSSISLNFRMC